ncbi:DNA-binding protein [Neiella marina]|uniref:DNA-binding protein n=1 Tax=Neiella holothuriorum TaxID=2870530 RepID=A0ABS7EBT3_9GAMM|nr:DNA-binding protein [Neiella holothuriorum]MBW8189674.1 DNA-binding protein [Neiella holothuriorum]
MTTKNVLTEAEASHYICMSRSFLRQARMDGNRLNRTPAPPFIKIGRSIRYMKGDLDNWLSSFQRLEHLGQFQGGRNA